MKKTVLFSLIFFISNSYFSQQWSWATPAGFAYLGSDPSYRVTSDGSGNLYSAITHMTQHDSACFLKVEKNSPSGSVLWSYGLGEGTRPMDLVVNNNRLYVSGYSYSHVKFPDATLYGNYPTFLVALNNNGTRQWIRFIEDMNCFTTDSHGDLIVVRYNPGNFAAGLWISKISAATGVTIWEVKHSAQFGPTTTMVRCDSNDNIYLGGYSNGKIQLNQIYYCYGCGATAGYLMKMNSVGQIDHVELIEDGPVSQFEIDKNDNIYVVGNFMDPMIIRQDTLNRTVACSNYYYCLNSYIAKLNPNGTCDWARELAGFENYKPLLSLGSQGALYLAGTVPTGVTIDSASAGANAPFVFKLNVAGTAEWVEQGGIGGNSICEVKDLCSTEGFIYLAGPYFNSANFGTHILPQASPRTQGYVAQFRDGVFTDINKSGFNDIDFSVAPNPGSGIFALQSEEQDYLVNVFNMQGKQIIKTLSASGNTSVDLASQPKGVYIMEVTCKDRKCVRKVVVQ